MKKFLLLAACLISVVGTAVAQEIIFEFEEEGKEFIQKVASKDKDNIEFYFQEENDENTVFTIYDYKFQETKKIVAPRRNEAEYISETTISQEREQSGTEVYAYDSYYDEFNDVKSTSIDYLRTYIRSTFIVEITTVEKGDTVFFYFDHDMASSIPVDDLYYYKYDTFGTKYPTKYWLGAKPKGSDRYHLYMVETYYGERPVYNGAWRTLDIETSYSYYDEYAYMSIEDYNYPIHHLHTENDLSNDIFDNNPKTYEYAIREHAIEEETDTIYYDYDYDSTKIYYSAPERRIRTIYNAVVTNTHIYSDGEKLFTIQGDLDAVMLVNNQTYLVTNYSHNYNNYNKYTIYRYNPATSSAEAIHEYTSRSNINMNNNIVNIELQQASSSDSELVLTSAAGKVYHRRRIAAGTKNIQLDMRNMPRGVYNISLLEKDKVIESNKVMKH